MNYAEIYKTIIAKYRQNQPNKKKEYCENHHIVPHSFGGTDDLENIITLPVRIHIFCHELLYMMAKQTGDKAKIAQSAWALKRFAHGTTKQKKSVKHCFKSKFFAQAIELGKKLQKDLRWITNDIENDQIFYWQPLPKGWHWGMKKYKKKNKWITNGKINKRIYDEDPVPEGWKLGITNTKKHSLIWITNGKIDRRINRDNPIPTGWRQGISKARNDGMIWIHKKDVPAVKGNCVQIKKGDPIPDGWEIGYGQTWTTGKIKITNGISEKKILPTDKIPDGWRIGGKPRHQLKK